MASTKDNKTGTKVNIYPESVTVSDIVDERTTVASVDVIWVQAGKWTLLLSDKELPLTTK